METAHQWPQAEIGLVRPREDTAPPASTSGGSAVADGVSSKPPAMSAERRIGRPQKKEQQVLNCPRCNSNNTKFCYYNNYSLTQPRYFCKTCRRYWTDGGSLRNVPVGGGSRKSKRSSSASDASLSSARRLMTPAPSASMQNPKFSEGQDLNLGTFHLPPELDGFSNMDLLRGGIPGRGGLVSGSFAPMLAPQEVYPSGFGTLQDFRGFQLDGISSAAGGSGGGGEGRDGGEGMLLFPPGGSEMGQNRGQGGDGQGFWTGMMGGGGSW